MNGYSQYQPEQSQNSNRWAYVEAKNYADWESILMAFPHLKTVNAPEECEKDQKVHGIVIRSANDDNVHKVDINLSRPSNMVFGRLPPKTKAK